MLFSRISCMVFYTLSKSQPQSKRTFNVRYSLGCGANYSWVSTPEVFPAPNRGTGTGIASFFNRICGLCAPIVAVNAGRANPVCSSWSMASHKDHLANVPFIERTRVRLWIPDSGCVRRYVPFPDRDKRQTKPLNRPTCLGHAIGSLGSF